MSMYDNINRNYSLYLLQQYTNFYIIVPSCRTVWMPVRYPDDEALKEAVKEWLEGQTEDFYFTELTVCQKSVANALNSVGIMLKNKV